MKRGKSIFTKEKIKSSIKPTKKKTMAAPVIVIAPAQIVIKVSAGKNNPQMKTTRKTDTVTRGDVEVTITGMA